MSISAVLPGSRWVIHYQTKRVKGGPRPIIGDSFIYEGLGHTKTGGHQVHILRVEDATEFEPGGVLYCSPDFFISHFMPG